MPSPKIQSHANAIRFTMKLEREVDDMSAILFVICLGVIFLAGCRLMNRLDSFLSSGTLHPYWDAAEEHKQDERHGHAA